ncbi:hypothetical protein [Modicisalibacter luteus]|uniref:YtxH domain-containing protein n=1 Tax=Modicisalibacter luteus TaxID=453962 RepID=A0ABV7LYT4_9GAMM|nr:hypothetical protein [Halomonas lutea]GHB05190.1 hypothetical protein GCM10007159_28770 [Halomonas lutea]
MKGLFAAGAAWWLRKSENRQKAKRKGEQAWNSLDEKNEREHADSQETRRN